MRKALLCWIHHFLFFWCCAPSTGWYVKIQSHFFGKNSLNVSNVKLFSNFLFNVFGFFMPFWLQWQLALYILSNFSGTKNLNGLNELNSLNNLSDLKDLYSLISSKNLSSEEKYIFWMVCYFLFLEKDPKKSK